jgi:nicotinate phosphoribosyltransferase
MVYKLVARADDGGRLLPVGKKSKDKRSIGGKKYALRRRTPEGVADAEVLSLDPDQRGDHDRPLLVPLVRDGEVVGSESLDDARARHEASRAELPPTALKLSRGEPAIPTIYEGT